MQGKSLLDCMFALIIGLVILNMNEIEKLRSFYGYFFKFLMLVLLVILFISTQPDFVSWFVNLMR